MLDKAKSLIITSLGIVFIVNNLSIYIYIYVKEKQDKDDVAFPMSSISIYPFFFLFDIFR